MSSPPAAAEQLQDRLLRLEGICEIERLVAEYSHGADKRDLRRFLAVWHEDALWDVGATVFRGRDEIAQAIQRQWAMQPLMTHWTANMSISLPPGGTQAHGMVDTDTLTQLSSGEWLQSAGTYHDVLELRQGRWGFVERRAELHFSTTLDSRTVRSTNS